MRSFVRKTLLICIIGTSLGGLGCAQHHVDSRLSAPKVATVGLLAPPVVLRGLRSGRIETASFRGKPLFINFFATWCLPCKVETPMFVSEYPKYRNRVNFLSVDAEEEQSAVSAFVVKYKIPWTIGIDSGQALMRYGVVSLPESVFVDRRGIVRAIYRGYMQPGNFWQDVARITK